MIWTQIARSLSIYLVIFAAILLIPLGISIAYQYYLPKGAHPQPYESHAFLATLVCTIILAGICYLIGRRGSKTLFRREAIALVAIIWILTPALSSLPFVFNGTLKHFEDAYFEMCSGLTTTGASVIYPGNIAPAENYQGVEAIGVGLLFWRSFTQWIGGIGIVLLFVAILPTLEVSAKILFQSESVGPLKEGLTPRIQQTALWLFFIYLGMSLLQLILLMPVMPFFDALTITMSTVSSGGFSIKNDGIMAYQSAFAEWIVIIFMIASTINFSLFYYLLRRKFTHLRNVELYVYLGLLLTFSLLVLSQIGGAFRTSLFQVVSVMSTTGFVATNYDYWPFAAQGLLLVAMFIGGMSGSTSGSIKVIRHYLLTRVSLQRIHAVFRPISVQALRLRERTIGQEMQSSVLTFFFVYIFIAVLATLVFIFDGIDPGTALGISASCLNNVGCSFGAAGPSGTFAILSPLGKYFASFLMLLGRLELFILLVLFFPGFWRKEIR